MIEDVEVSHQASLLLLVMVTDPALQHHFSSCLDHSGYVTRTKLFGKYKNAADPKTN